MLAERIRFVTGNFYQLQGLRLVPFALMLLWLQASSRGWLDWLPGLPVQAPSDLGNAWGPAAFLVAVAAAMAVEDKYRARYGSVLQHKRSRRNLGVALAVIAFLIALVLDRVVTWPVLISPLVIVVALALIVRSDGPFRIHYVLPAAAWLGLSVMPLLGFKPGEVQMAFSLVSITTLLVCGIGDHFLLVRTLSPRGKRLDATKSAVV